MKIIYIPRMKVNMVQVSPLHYTQDGVALIPMASFSIVSKIQKMHSTG